MNWWGALLSQCYYIVDTLLDSGKTYYTFITRLLHVYYTFILRMLLHCYYTAITLLCCYYVVITLLYKGVNKCVLEEMTKGEMTKGVLSQ